MYELLYDMFKDTFLYKNVQRFVTLIINNKLPIPIA